MTTLASVMGHQGGWDEALIVGVPLLVVGWLVVTAWRRAQDLPEDPEADAAAEAERAAGSPDE